MSDSLLNSMNTQTLNYGLQFSWVCNFSCHGVTLYLNEQRLFRNIRPNDQSESSIQESLVIILRRETAGIRHYLMKYVINCIHF